MYYSNTTTSLESSGLGSATTWDDRAGPSQLTNPVDTCYGSSTYSPKKGWPVYANQETTTILADNIVNWKLPIKSAAEPIKDTPVKKHGHYYKNVSNLDWIDVYRVIDLFGVKDACLQHAIKKLLVTGGRDGNKSSEQDVRDVIASCNRWLEMQVEDKNGV